MPPTMDPDYVLKLWDFASLLLYRAEQADGPEKKLLQEQADEMMGSIESYLGYGPVDGNALARLLEPTP